MVGDDDERKYLVTLAHQSASSVAVMSKPEAVLWPNGICKLYGNRWLGLMPCLAVVVEKWY
jgi:hypothetical protein